MVSVEGGGIVAGLRHALRRARPFLSVFFDDSSPFTIGVIFPVLVGAAGIAGLFVLGIANDQTQAANQIALLALCSESSFVSSSPRPHLPHPLLFFCLVLPVD